MDIYAFVEGQDLLDIFSCGHLEEIPSFSRWRQDFQRSSKKGPASAIILASSFYYPLVVLAIPICQLQLSMLN